jgi:uncharacterized protein (UPF0335 family)
VNQQDNKTIEYFIKALQAQGRIKDECNARLAELYRQARQDGIDPQALRAAVRVLELSPAEALRQRGLVSVYLTALGIKESDAQPVADEDSWAPQYEPEPEHDDPLIRRKRSWRPI